jgi:hypothetical protein
MAIGAAGVLMLLVLMAGSFFWLWTVRDCLANEQLSGTERFYWLALMAVTHALGALSYWVNRGRLGGSQGICDEFTHDSRGPVARSL